MGCKRLDTDFFSSLEVVHRKKKGYRNFFCINYYPFGLTHKGYNTEKRGRTHKYGYGGKEENQELGLEWLDFSARNYDAALGRWMNIDPLADQMRRHSPYNYAFDNPIYFIDPDGMMPQGPPGNDPPNKRGLEVKFTVGVGKTFGVHAELFGLDAGFLIDRGTATTEMSTLTGTTRSRTEGFAVEAIGVSFKKTTATDISKVKTDTDGIGLQHVPEQTVNSEQTKTTESGIFFASTETETKESGTISVPEKSTLVTTKGVTIPATSQATFSSETKFNGNGNVRETDKRGKIGIGAQIDVGVRLGIEVNYVGEPGESINDGVPVCFIAGTKISMSDGSLKNIENIKKGQLVKSYNLQNKKIENKEVLITEISSSNIFIEITFNDGTKNINTLTHPYYIKHKGWASFDEKTAKQKYGVTVAKLKEGDTVFKLKTEKVTELKINKIEVIKENKRTYNLSNVKDNHNFFANGILVHNRS